MTEPNLDLENVHNFRDFGGWATRHGLRVARGRLYRSAHLSRATDGDLARLRAMGIALVADLRRPNERTAEPPPAGCGWRVISNDIGAPEELAPHLVFLRDLDVISAPALRDYMHHAYETLPFEERHIELYGRVFQALAAGDGPLLVHCAAGKDRTGVLCALILDALGVAHEDVVADYVATNLALNLDGVARQTAARIAKRIGREVTAEEIRPFSGVAREYLETAWRVIEDRVGSLEGYRRDVLGVTEAQEDALRAALLEPSAQVQVAEAAL